MMLKTNQSIQPKSLNNKDISMLRQTMQQLPQLHQEKTRLKLLQKQTNDIDFYKITPKEQLPKNLQKMNFQTLNTKQNNPSSLVKIFNRNKQKLNDQEIPIRKALKSDNGELMFLSEIYQYFDDDLDQKLNRHHLIKDFAHFNSMIGQLDQWQKKASKKKQSHLINSINISNQKRISRIKLPIYNPTEDKKRQSMNLSSNSQVTSNNTLISQKKQFIVKKFKIGSDYRAEIQKNLQLINYTHSNETNLINKYSLIQNSSKLIKKELEQMKDMIEKEIQEKMKKLYESRKQHHRLYQQKLRLQLEQQQIQEQLTKQQGNILQMLSLSTMGYNFSGQQTNHPPKLKNLLVQKKKEIGKNESKVYKVKKNIEFLEQQILKNQQQLKNILSAQKSYYQVSFKNGIDFRDTGLVWILKKLGLNLGTDSVASENLIQIAIDSGTQFPEYLDKKSKIYLLSKTKNQQHLQILINQKRDFVNQIGKENKPHYFQRRNNSRKNSIKLMDKNLSVIALNRNQNTDYIKESSSFNLNQQIGDIPKKYIRSAQKISALREQYIRNQNLLKMSQSRGGIKFGYHLQGMTGKQIYQLAGQKIKKVDFSKLKKQKNLDKNDKIYEYQSLLKKIEELHMHMQEQDIQHENHLLTHYRDQKDTFFVQAAACFGVKRAYSLIIKNFSWKSSL